MKPEIRLTPKGVGDSYVSASRLSMEAASELGADFERAGVDLSHGMEKEETLGAVLLAKIIGGVAVTYVVRLIDYLLAHREDVEIRVRDESTSAEFKMPEDRARCIEHFKGRNLDRYA